MDEFVKGFDIKWTPSMCSAYEKFLSRGIIIGVVYDPAANEYYFAVSGMEEAYDIWEFVVFTPEG